MTYPDNGINIMSVDHWTNQQFSVPTMGEIAVWPTTIMGRNYFATVGGLYNDYLPDPFHCAVASYGDGIFTSLDSIYERNGRSFKLYRYLPIPAYYMWTTNAQIDPPPFYRLPIVEKFPRTPIIRDIGQSKLIPTLSYKLASEVNGKDKDKKTRSREQKTIVKSSGTVPRRAVV
jgi:hypothetical protein